MSRTQRHAWLGLGGNIGDVQQAMAEALRWLHGNAEITVETVSAIYKTPPWGFEDQPWFLNCCARITTSLSPEDLLSACQEAERLGKRERTVRWGPRTIDIDIIAYQGVEQNEQRLTIPHPRATERAFVLVPLAAIAPELMLQGQTVQDGLTAIDISEIEVENPTTDWWH